MALIDAFSDGSGLGTVHHTDDNHEDTHDHDEDASPLVESSPEDIVAQRCRVAIDCRAHKHLALCEHEKRKRRQHKNAAGDVDFSFTIQVNGIIFHDDHHLYRRHKQYLSLGVHVF